MSKMLNQLAAAALVLAVATALVLLTPAPLDAATVGSLVLANVPIIGSSVVHLNALRQDVADLKTKGGALLDAADARGGELTAEEEERYNEIEAQIAANAGEIERLERLAERRRNMEPVSRISVGEPPESPERNPTAGFASMAEFALAVMSAAPNQPNQFVDERLAALYQSQGPGGPIGRETRSTDGYEVPPQFRDEVWELLSETSDFFNMTDVEPTAGNTVERPADATTPWGATGVKAYWAAEAEQMSASKPDTSDLKLGVHKLYAFVDATDELLEDAPRLASRLTAKAAQAISWTRDAAVFYGDGVGKPLGFVNHPATVVVAKESTQEADTVVAENVANMFARMLAQGMGGAVWTINSDVLPQLMTMTLGNQPIWTPPATGFANAPGGFLFGRPIMPTEHCQSLGSLGDIMFADFMGYYSVVKEGGVQFASSIHLWFDYGVQAFRWTTRLGGQPYLSAAVEPAHGSSTKSFFVALEERAA